MRKSILTLWVLLSTTASVFSQKDSIYLQHNRIVEITNDLEYEIENLLSIRLIKSNNTNHHSLALSVKMSSKNNAILFLNDFSFSNVKDGVWTLYPSYGLDIDEMVIFSKLEKMTILQ
ncbi:MAG: hypothetical protein HC892_19690 [Saprospiraceae bacterium]|nr:hypothetical protein [Saprospiraceae bacterium]